MQNRGLSNTAPAIGAATNPFTSVSSGVSPYSYSSSISFSPYGFIYVSNSNFIGKPSTVSTAGISSTFSVSDNLGVTSTTTSTKLIKICSEITAADLGSEVSGTTYGKIFKNIAMLQGSGGVPNNPGTALKTGAVYTYYLSSGTLPPGMAITNIGNGGFISGTPTTTGTYTFTIGVYDNNLSDMQTDPIFGSGTRQYATYKRTFVFKVA